MSCIKLLLPTATRPLLCLLCAIALFTLPPSISHADTLSDTRSRGTIRCGVNQDLPGFSSQNSLGEYSGFDVEFCRAVSTAVFRSPDRVEYIPLSASERLIALGDGRIDLLSRNTTWTLSRNVDYAYVGVTFYDGQGFMVPKTTGIRTALELDDQPICVSRGTTTELNAADFFAESEMRYKPIYFDDETDAAQAYIDGDCSALTTDRSALAAQRASFEEPGAHTVLPDVISKEPLGPVVRNNDPRWENIARWTLACMINAEELGVTQASVLSVTVGNAPPSVRRLLGLEGDAGERLDLEPTWCANVITQLGNYSEAYERYIGSDTPVGLDRGVNALWTNGGLIYSPPIR